MTTHRLVYNLALGIVFVFALATGASAQSTVHLPFVATGGATCPLPGSDSVAPGSPQPDEETPAPDMSTEHILPVGHQLGDVGQYYSQVAPSLSSIVHIANIASSTQPFTLTLYGDTGNLVRSLQSCRIEAGDTWMLQASNGRLAFHQDGRVVEPHDLCDSVSQGQDAQGHAAARLHGLYHAQIAADAPSALDVRVHIKTDPAYPQATFHTAGVYEAVRGEHTTSPIHLSGLLATRDRQAWWDTEVIVQNVSDVPIDVSFKLCAGTGRCFDNNAARLAPFERRLFLASHLLYEDTPDGPVERAGWYAGSIYATRTDAVDEVAPIAVVTNYFRQPVEAEALYPKAEHGSQCLYSTTPQQPAQVLEIPASRATPSYLRIYNPAASANRISVVLLDPTGLVLDRWSAEVAPHGTWTIVKRDQADPPAKEPASAEAEPGAGHGTTPVYRIVAESAVSVLAWDQHGLRRPQGHTTGSDTWWTPLVAAPVVPFRWDDGQAPPRAQQPAAQFGLAETRPQDHRLRPAWAQALNWYDARYRAVGFEERWCHEAVETDAAYSTYIPLWRGLGRCNPASSDDRSCVNIDARLQTIRNNLPSSCAGRPLFMANEPDLGNQASMTLTELGRLTYVLRDWPGELFSPAFASYSYERPIYPPEGTEWCRQAVAESLCPQTPGCERCRQDGVVDGAVDPYDISFKRLEAYFAEPDRWALGQVWRFEDFVEGMLLHFYPEESDVLDDQHWRAVYLQQYRDRAAEAGWPIIVKEYGFAIWPNEFGVAPSMSLSDIADRLDDARRFLQKHLGNGDPEYGGNPFKLFWYQTGCDDLNNTWGKLCLFHEPEQLVDPVGTCWYDDAMRNDATDRQCGQTGVVQ